MFESIMKLFKKTTKKEDQTLKSKDAAKERLHLVLMQDRANVSADFLDLMKQEIIEVIKKYIDIDENAMDVRLTNKENSDGTNGAPALYANIPILNIKDEARQETKIDKEINNKEQTNKTESKTENTQKVECKEDMSNSEKSTSPEEKEQKYNNEETDKKINQQKENEQKNTEKPKQYPNNKHKHKKKNK